MFENIKIHTYSNGLRGIIERLWHDLRFRTAFIQESSKTHPSGLIFSRFMAGRYIFEPRGWYKFIQSLSTTTKREEKE